MSAQEIAALNRQRQLRSSDELLAFQEEFKRGNAKPAAKVTRKTRPGKNATPSSGSAPSTNRTPTASSTAAPDAALDPRFMSRAQLFPDVFGHEAEGVAEIDIVTMGNPVAAAPAPAPPKRMCA